MCPLSKCSENSGEKMGLSVGEVIFPGIVMKHQLSNRILAECHSQGM